MAAFQEGAADRRRAEVFLAALRAGETVARAAARAGVSTTALYRHRKRNALFAQLMEQAQQAGRQARARDRERRRAPFRAMRYRLVPRDPQEP
ncbi:TetR family transcriptional regulator [Streptomyces sp. NBRC 110611]|uniref:helix-turn-helix domain-containing protein n=1 Tax=Streptomyces sp. NBRC 110611 TaxID=1621259 RepID=UPI00082C665C|nr:helix-turn-helix domain-containing protein [Streptomyces sp. NBRC 110611]GAU67089.1 TetR family transcriptional regulator [Streptomyces sp. NBRC 110611]